MKLSKQIKLRIDVFEKWTNVKNASGFEKKTHNEFADYLLQSITCTPGVEAESQVIDIGGAASDITEKENSFVGKVNVSNVSETTLTASEISLTINQKRNLMSTPDTKQGSIPRKLFKPDFPLYQINEKLSEDEITHEYCDPFQKFIPSDDSEDDHEQSSVCSESDNENNIHSDDTDNDLLSMAGENCDQTLQILIDKVNGLQVETEQRDIDFLVCDFDCSKYMTKEQIDASTPPGTNISKNIVDMSLCTTMNSCDTFIDASVAANADEVRRKLQDALTKSYDVNEFQLESSLLERERILVSVEKLKELRGDICGFRFTNGSRCDDKLSFEASGRGSVRQLKWKCPHNHTGKWNSSEVLAIRHSTPIYLNDLLITSCVLLSGNNWKKIELFCKFLNFAIPTAKVFSRNQNFYFAPQLRSLWSTFKDKIISIIGQYSEVCLCGDGRNDSPGHCARFCTYILMEHFTKIIVDLEIFDSRESKGISVNMERDALVRLLLRLRHVLEISELTTDASATIMKTVRELSEEYPALSNVIHSLDIWHKAKSLRKALHAAAKTKGNEELTPWIESITNHFWHCCQNCGRDLELLKDMWFGVLHHVCGEHVWCESQCSHGELVKDDPKTPLDKNSKAMEALRLVVMDPRFVNSLKFYTRFRHTSDLENFNSMLLKYAPKRIAFDYDYYEARMLLAAMDHNIHLFRSPATTKTGQQLFRRQYCKRVGHWHAEPIKEPKSYPHIPYILSSIIRARVNDQEPIDRKFFRRDVDPKLISPTIAMKEPPSLSDLVAERVSRIEKNQ